MQKRLFSELGLSEPILKAVAKLGFEQTSPIQSAAIPALMEGKDILGQSATGSGKTAAFAIPAIERVADTDRKVQILVLTPTRELCTQVAEEFARLSYFRPKVHAVPIYGGASYDRQFSELRKGPQIVIGTPGRVIDHLGRNTLDLSEVKMVVLDECDRMLDMGFREDIERILRSAPKERQSVFFSATLPPTIRKLIDEYTKVPQHIRIEAESLTVPTVSQVYFDVPPRSKLDALTRLIDIHDARLSIVFANTQRMVDDIADALQARGYSTDRLHGGMTQVMRTRTMAKFKKSEFEVLVATDVAGRGIDVDELDLVINFDLPYDPEDYVHRIGRTGRAGRSGVALTLLSGREIYRLQNIERLTKVRIRRGTVPTWDMVEEKRMGGVLEKVRTAITEDKHTSRTIYIDQLMDEGHSGTDLAAAMLHLLLQAEGIDTGSPDADPFARRGGPTPAPVAVKGKAKPAPELVKLPVVASGAKWPAVDNDYADSSDKVPAKGKAKPAAEPVRSPDVAPPAAKWPAVDNDYADSSEKAPAPAAKAPAKVPAAPAPVEKAAPAKFAAVPAKPAALPAESVASPAKTAAIAKSSAESEQAPQNLAEPAPEALKKSAKPAAIPAKAEETPAKAEEAEISPVESPEATPAPTTKTASEKKKKGALSAAALAEEGVGLPPNPKSKAKFEKAEEQDEDEEDEDEEEGEDDEVEDSDDSDDSDESGENADDDSDTSAEEPGMNKKNPRNNKNDRIMPGDSDAPRGKPRDKAPSHGSDLPKPATGYKWVTVTIGKEHGVKPRDLVDAVTAGGEFTGAVVGLILLHPDASSIQVRTEAAAEVVEALDGGEIEGHKVKAFFPKITEGAFGKKQATFGDKKPGFAGKKGGFGKGGKFPARTDSPDRPRPSYGDRDERGGGSSYGTPKPWDRKPAGERSDSAPRPWDRKPAGERDDRGPAGAKPWEKKPRPYSAGPSDDRGGPSGSAWPRKPRSFDGPPRSDGPRSDGPARPSYGARDDDRRPARSSDERPRSTGGFKKPGGFSGKPGFKSGGFKKKGPGRW